jgi:hypothetical protein
MSGDHGSCLCWWPCRCHFHIPGDPEWCWGHSQAHCHSFVRIIILIGIIGLVIGAILEFIWAVMTTSHRMGMTDRNDPHCSPPLLWQLSLTITLRLQPLKLVSSRFSITCNWFHLYTIYNINQNICGMRCVSRYLLFLM